MKGNQRNWRMGEALRSLFLAVFGYRFVIVPVIVLDKVFDWEICI